MEDCHSSRVPLIHNWDWKTQTFHHPNQPCNTTHCWTNLLLFLHQQSIQPGHELLHQYSQSVPHNSVINSNSQVRIEEFEKGSLQIWLNFHVLTGNPTVALSREIWLNPYSRSSIFFSNTKLYLSFWACCEPGIELWSTLSCHLMNINDLRVVSLPIYLPFKNAWSMWPLVLTRSFTSLPKSGSDPVRWKLKVGLV